MTETDPDGLDMDTLASVATSYIESQNLRRFTLVEPLMVTVKKKNGSFSKLSLIGGEEFRAMRCYAGKRGSLIYVFKPMDVANYVEMEMNEAQAKRSLDEFAVFIKNVGDGEFDRLKREAQQNAALEAEREKLAANANKYADLGWGNW